MPGPMHFTLVFCTLCDINWEFVINSHPSRKLSGLPSFTCTLLIKSGTFFLILTTVIPCEAVLRGMWGSAFRESLHKVAQKDDLKRCF